MKPTIPRIPVLATVSFLLLITIAILWARSPRHADVLMFYTPAGHLTGMASDRGGMLFCTSDISFGPEMGLSADAMSTSGDDLAQIRQALFDPANEKLHLLGFRVVAVTLGAWGWKFSAILVPYWALLILLSILPLDGVRWVIVRRRRQRRGQCVACGYDLRQSPQRCPECACPVAGAAPGLKSVSPVLGALRTTITGVLPWLLMGAVVASAALLFSRGRHAAAMLATAPPEEAFLARPVGPIDLPNVESMQQELQMWVRGSVVHLGPASAAPHFVRSYPLGDLLRLMQADLDQREAGFGSTHPPQGPSDRTVADALQERIMAMVREDDWTDNGGDLGYLQVAGGR